jgi:hypothetical protein
MVAVLVPAACSTFLLGIVLAAACRPRWADLNWCVLSRLCSSRHNPHGYGYLTLGMIALPVLLAPAPAWLTRRLGGCPTLSRWGRFTMRLGLAATAGVGLERAWCPTHWTPLESLHLLLAGLAFAGLWLGMAMISGAADAGAGPRVRWRWLIQPRWYLAGSILPILVLFGSYLPVVMVPWMHAGVIAAWPPSLGFVRSVSFWQAYLVGGLVLSLLALTIRAIVPNAEPRVIAARTALPTRKPGPRWYTDRQHGRSRGPRMRPRHVPARSER